MSSTLTSNRPTVADLDSTVVYVVYSEDGFTEPNGWSTPSDKCIKEAPPCDLARHIHSLQVLLPEGEAGFFGLIPRAGAREEPERLQSHGSEQCQLFVPGYALRAGGERPV